MIPDVIEKAARVIHPVTCEEDFRHCAKEWGCCFAAAVSLYHAQLLKETNG